MPVNEKDIRQRRVYYFRCSECQKKRQSFKRRRARAEMCRKCRRVWVNPNQLALV